MGIPNFGELGDEYRRKIAKSNSFELGGWVMPPKGWIKWKTNLKNLVRTRKVTPVILPYSCDFMKISSINSFVNQDTIYVRDADEDAWEIAGSQGDCEDYALKKREILTKEMGLPEGAFPIAHCYRPNGIAHAVLIARTDEGDFVLDSLVDPVRLWWEYPYQWSALERPGAFWWSRIIT